MFTLTILEPDTKGKMAFAPSSVMTYLLTSVVLKVKVGRIIYGFLEEYTKILYSMNILAAILKSNNCQSVISPN